MGDKPMAKPPPNTKYYPTSVPGSNITGEWNYCVSKTDKPSEVILTLPSVPEQVFQKIKTRPCCLYLHGGAYIGMSAGTHRSWCRKLSQSADMAVFSLNYRLAPENPFPCGLMDAIETYRWLVSPISEGGVGVSPKSMIIMGDSAGGGLAAALALAILHNKAPLYNPLSLPFQSATTKTITNEQLSQLETPALLILLSPWLDIECKNDSWTENAEYCYLPYLGSQVGGWYAGHQNKDRDPIPLDHPLLSPLNGSLNGFPMTLLQVGTAESLVGDAQVFKEKAIKANVPLTYEEYEDMCHVFHMFYSFVPDQTRKALASIVLHVQRVAEQNTSNTSAKL